MGALVSLPRDTEAPVVTTYYCEVALYMAQVHGCLCPHYHYVKAQAVKCHRRMVRFFEGKRPAIARQHRLVALP